MAETVSEENGLSYDFGLQMASGVVQGLKEAALEYISIVGSIYALYDTIADMDDIMNKNMVSFGGYANTLKAIEFTSKQIVEGKTIFDQEDMMAGMKAMQRAGLDAKKNFDLINKAADGAGTSFTEMADTIRSGNFNALSEMGIITDRTAMSLNRMGFTQQQAMQKTLGYLKEAEAKGMFKDTIQTLPSILRRFKEFGVEFMRAIIGDPKDPEGFANTVKRTFTEIADFIHDHLEGVRKVGALIGKALSFIVHVVFDFVKAIGHAVKSTIGSMDGFFANFRDKMMSFGLWLEILRVQIKSWFKDHEELIKNIVKGIMAILAITAIAKVGDMIYAIVTALTSLSGIMTVLTPLIEGFALIMANLMVATGVVALVAAVYLLWKYWDDIKGVLKKAWDIFVSFNIPLQFLIKYAGTIKNVFINIYTIIKNLIVATFYNLVLKIQEAVAFVKMLYEKFALVRIVIDGIKIVFNTIKDIISWVVDKIGSVWKFIEKVTGVAAKLTGEQAENSKAMVNGVQKVSSPSVPTSMASAPAAASYASPKDSQQTTQTSGVMVQSGAVVINTGSADPQKIAEYVQKYLSEWEAKSKSRSGG